MKELNYNTNELKSILTKENLLNSDQKIIYYTIIKALNDEINQKVFFVDSSEDYRKTFLFNIILAKIRLDGVNKLPSHDVAYCGWLRLPIRVRVISRSDLPGVKVSP